MRCIKWISSVILRSSDYSRQDSTKLCSCYDSFRIEFMVRGSIGIQSHESKLTSELDVKSKFWTLIADVIEGTIFAGIGYKSAEWYSEIADHLGHMRSIEHTSHIRFFDRIHRSDAMCVSSEICVIQFCRSSRSYNASDRKISCSCIASCCRAGAS